MAFCALPNSDHQYHCISALQSQLWKILVSAEATYYVGTHSLTSEVLHSLSWVFSAEKEKQKQVDEPSTHTLLLQEGAYHNTIVTKKNLQFHAAKLSEGKIYAGAE